MRNAVARSAFDPGTTGLRISMLSTYPPTICGLATFSSALERSLVEGGHTVSIVRVDDGSLESSCGRDVAGVLVNGSASSVHKAAAVLSRADVAVIQHEYGIFGGADGEEILDVVREIQVPVVVVLHTVPDRPTPNQTRIMEELCALASRVVVLTRCARDRLLSGFEVAADKVVTIPHGALLAADLGASHLNLSRPHPQLLSWGLLGPGKGIENVIDALAALHAEGTSVRYTVSGMTHPKVVSRRGEEYRNSLVERARRHGLAQLVDFDQAYRSPAALTRFIAQSSAVVLPYDSTDQVVSGVLVDSIAAGRPVIATAFPHAVELLSDGAGIVVPHGDPDALLEAIRRVVEDDRLHWSMVDRARQLASMHSWSAVGRRYATEMMQLRRERHAVSA